MIRLNTQVQTLPTAAPQAPGATNDRPTVSEYVRDTIEALRRAGGCDTVETEQVAIATLRDLCRLKASQARELWIQYAATVNPA